MARAVAAALRDDEVLLFEAGTGVGKSLAYLVPGIIHAMDQARQMIVSTHTISLQEQIETKDLPLCRRLFDSVEALRPYAKFKSAVLVGKANYLCTTRLAHALQARHELFPDRRAGGTRSASPPGRRSRRDGLRHELQPAPSPEVWEAVNADSSTCSHKTLRRRALFLPAGPRPAAARAGHHRQPQPALHPRQRRRRRRKGRHARRAVPRRLRGARRGADRARGGHRAFRPAAEQLRHRPPAEIPLESAEKARPAPPARRREGEAAGRGRAGGRGAVFRFSARHAGSPSSPSSGCARRALPSRGSTPRCSR